MIFLIRHGQTAGNLEGRYIGSRTDEPLCKMGKEQLAQRKMPPVDVVFASPMKRCIQTAQLLYPEKNLELIEDFRECDFGAFEGKNYRELDGQTDYQKWIDSGGEAAFPGGESRKTFAARCVKAFLPIWNRRTEGDFALVAHGGTLMAIMEAFACPQGRYFDFQIENGAGFMLRPDGTYEKISR